MIEFENVEVFGWEASIRGLRSPMNSWDKSDSQIKRAHNCYGYTVKELKELMEDNYE